MRTARGGVASVCGVAAVAALSLCACRPPFRVVDEAELRTIVRAEVEECRTPSLVVVAVRGDEVVYAQAAGEADVATGRLATLETVYVLFSITKLFTATAVMQLVDQGLVDIDRPIADYLPELPIDNPFDRPVTVRTLLSHSSGLPNPLAFGWAQPASDPRPSLREHALEVFREHGRVEFEPGTAHRYTNMGYLALGLLVEEVAGRSFEEQVAASILEPLGMRRTGFVWDEAALADAAVGYSLRGAVIDQLARAYADPRLFGPPIGHWSTLRPFHLRGPSYGGMIGTAPEVARFLSMHLGGGSFRGRRLLSAESVAAMQEVQRTPSGEPLGYALGWHVGEIAGHRYYNHMGTGGGFRPAVRIYPDLGYGVVVLANRSRYNPRGLTHRVLGEPRGS